MEFIAFISLRGLSHSTARSYISGISFCCKIKGLSDTTNNFVVSKMLKGFLKLNRRVDSRLPITHDLLGQIISTLPTICYTAYETALFKAVFCMAFFGFFRLGNW